MALFDNEDPVIEEKNYLEEFVGEGKKFKTPEDLARGKAESDAFILKLQREAQELREDISKRTSEEDFMTRLSSIVSPAREDTPPPARDAEQQSGVTPESIQELVAKALAERDAQSREAQNLNAVKQRLQEDFGPTYPAKLEGIAKELGVGKDFLEGVARQNPNAFFRLVGSPAPRQEEVGIPKTQMNMDGFKPTVGKRYSDYKKLRETNPTEYHSVRVQQEMHKEAQRQGESFFDI